MSCSSIEKQANEKLEKGEYDSSLQLFEQALQREPQKTELKEGLKKARSGVLSQKLIEVRRARMANQNLEALKLLRSVLQLEKEWDTFPPAAAKFTQEEETDFAFKPFQSLIDSKIQNHTALLAQSEFNKYKPLFDHQKFAESLQSISTDILTEGRSDCRKRWNQNSIKFPYFSDFLARYCQFWGIHQKQKEGFEKALNANLVSQIVFTGTIENLSASENALFSSKLNESFQNSSFYSEKGRLKINLNSSGKYLFNHTKSLMARLHPYKEEVPYNVIENVTKTRPVQKITQQSRFNPVSGKTETTPVIENQTETYTEQVSVVRYHTTDKQFPYNALFHHQEISLQYLGQIQFEKEALPFSASFQNIAEGDEQTIRNEGIGLFPSQPKLIEPQKWLESTSNGLKLKFEEKLSEYWISKYCSSSFELESPETAENIQLCFKNKEGKQTSFVKNWYSQNFSMNVEVVEKMLMTSKASN